MRNGAKVVGYGRVSTREQGDSGLGLDAQRNVVELYCDRAGLELSAWLTDVASGKSTAGRAGLDKALATCTAGAAGGVVVAKLDRLARSVFDFASLLKRAQSERWTLVIVDIGLDLSTPHGRMVASIMATIAEWEREMISVRTKDALVEARRRGSRFGRPSGIDDATIARIKRERANGAGLWSIARDLTRDGVPTAQGGDRWTHSTVRYVLHRYADLGENDETTP